MLRIGLLAILIWPVLLLASETSDVTRARALSAEVAHASGRADAGSAPDADELARLQRAWVESSHRVDADSEAGQKLQATERALSALMRRVKSSAAARSLIALTRNEYLLERVAEGHGDTCGNSMGLSIEQPSRLTLNAGSDAWFYVSTRTATTIRVATQSYGPDPSLEVVANCSPTSARLASNDDTFGLDAAVNVATDDHETVFVHLTNRGEGGVVNVVLTTSTATVSGTVIDTKSGKPLASAYVQLYESDGSYPYFSTFTDTNGKYSFTPGVTGSFYATAAADGHVAEIYPAGYCDYTPYENADICDVTHAKAINVPVSGAIANINFSLSSGARLSGQVRDGNNDPLPASVQLFGANVYGGQTTTYADAAGHFAFSALPPGTYYLQAQFANYISQNWDHINCPVQQSASCDTSTATPIVVGSADKPDVDFTLQQTASVYGTVSVTNGPLSPYPYANVYLLDHNGSYISQTYVDDTGAYSFGAVPIGTYYAYVAGNDFFSQLYNLQDCLSSCASQLDSGTPLTISANGQQVEADFVVKPYPSLTGHVSDAPSGTPLPNVVVVLTMSPNSGNYLATSTTDASGNYVVPAIAPGTYYVWAQSPDHVDQIYDGITCELPGDNYYYTSPKCDVSTATPITASYEGLSPSIVNFALQPSSSVAGHVIERAGPGSDLIPLGIVVTLFDGTDAAIAAAAVDASGNYQLTDLASGTYYAVATSSYSSEQYLSQMWQNTDCANTCAPTTGTSITVQPSTSVTGIDFQLTRVNGIVGRIVDSSGVPIRGAVIDMFNVSDHSYAGGAGADALGYFAVSTTGGGSYFVATEAGGGYVDQVFSGISCPNGSAYDGKCSLSGATAINMGNNGTQPHVVDFTLQIADRLFANGFE